MKGDAGFAVTKAMAKKAQKLIDDALEHGATSIVGGNQERGDSGAALVRTFITGVKSGNPIHDVESFGPSATVYVVADEKEAIEVANGSSYGLTGAIHTNNILEALRLAKQMEVGLVAINSMTLWEELPVPMGGVKVSGWGKNNGRFGIEEFLIQKAVAIIDAAGQPIFGAC